MRYYAAILRHADAYATSCRAFTMLRELLVVAVMPSLRIRAEMSVGRREPPAPRWRDAVCFDIDITLASRICRSVYRLAARHSHVVGH